MSCGRLFHSVGPAAANARSLTVRRWVRGTLSCSEDADRRCRRDGISTKRWRSSDKYVGARPCSDRNTVVASLYWMRSEERGQWRLTSVSVIWSERRKPVIDLAAAFITDQSADDGAGTPGCRSAWCCRSQADSVPVRRQATGRRTPGLRHLANYWKLFLAKNFESDEVEQWRNFRGKAHRNASINWISSK